MDFGGELAKYGCFVGSHAIVILSDKDNLADVALNLISFLNMRVVVNVPYEKWYRKNYNIIKNKSKWDKELLYDISEVMANASICGLGQAASNPILSVLKFFPKDTGIK